MNKWLRSNFDGSTVRNLFAMAAPWMLIGMIVGLVALFTCPVLMAECFCLALFFITIDRYYEIKDGCVTDTGNSGYRTVKTYYIFSREQLERKRAKITELCQSNHARAYITLNRRNAEEVACTAIQKYAKLIQEGNCYQGYRIWDSSCGYTRARGYKPLWVVDVDSKDENYLNTIIEIVNSCRGAQDIKVKHVIPTAHGYHLITIGFDTNQFAQQLAIRNLDSIDIQKDNPTLLYFDTAD